MDLIKPKQSKMDHIKIPNGKPLTDAELNKLCSQPKGEPTHIGNGFQIYISWGGWKYMEPERMKKIMNRMLKADLKYSGDQINQIKTILNELNATSN